MAYVNPLPEKSMGKRMVYGAPFSVRWCIPPSGPGCIILAFDFMRSS